MEFVIWVAEAENGSIQFDSPPSSSDVRNCCEDLEGDIEVYEIELIETSRQLCFTVEESK